jgi:hypothetical protein
MRMLVFVLTAVLILPVLADAQPRRAMDLQRNTPQTPQSQDLQAVEVTDYGTTRCRLHMVRAHSNGVTLQCTNPIETDWTTNLHMYFAPYPNEDGAGASGNLVASIASSAMAADAVVRIVFWRPHRYDAGGCGFTTCRRILMITYE